MGIANHVLPTAGRPGTTGPELPVRLPQGAVRDLLLLAAIWFASLLVVNPMGDFPLNDDWSFGRAVHHLLQTGQFRPTGWTGMPLISQALWGALFCLPGGFSFSALRFSTLLLSLCSLCAVYLLVRQVHPSRLLAAVATLTVGFNPIYYPLAMTFMTDVPFTTLLLGAAWFFLRYLQGGSDMDQLCGLAFALAATLCRQLGLAAPLAFLISLLWSRGISVRWVIRGLLPLILCLGALFAFRYWLQVSGRLPALYSVRHDTLVSALFNPKHLVVGVPKHLGTGLIYLGGFSLAVIALICPGAVEMKRNRRAVIVALCVGCAFLFGAALVLARYRMPMPTEGNIVLAQGVGPLSLRDMHVLNLPHLPSVGKSFWLAVTAASLLGGAFLTGGAAGMAGTHWRSLRRTRLQVEQSASVFCLLCAGIYLGPILVIGGWDRYYVPALPFLLVGMAALAARTQAHHTRPRLALALLLLGSLSLFAVLGTRDYLAWNRVRWTALHDLLADGKVTPADVDGGFEFNGWHLYDAAYKEKPDKSWYWVDQDTYLLAFAEMPGYATVKEYRFSHWLPPYAGKILVLKKQGVSLQPFGRSTASPPAR
jgi:hypothetical protein